MSPVELTYGRGGKEGSGEGAKSYDGEKAWSSILSDVSVSGEVSRRAYLLTASHVLPVFLDLTTS